MAACLLAALGTDEQETEGQHVRANVGALLLAEALVDIKNIRRLLTPPKNAQ